MVPANLERKSLYEEAKAGLHSLLQQTAAVFIGFAIMLLITGGVPSAMIVALSFFLSTACVAFAEKTRLVTSERMQEFEVTSDDLTVVPSSDFSNSETVTLENSDSVEDIDPRKKVQKSPQKEDSSQAKLRQNEEATHRASILLKYTKNGLYLETSSLSLENFIAQRVVLSLRLGQRLRIEQGLASFLVPSDSLGFSRFLSAIQDFGDDAITTSPVDEEYIEINVRGTWIALDEEAIEGIFLMSTSYEIASSLYRLWHEQSQRISLQHIGSAA